MDIKTDCRPIKYYLIIYHMNCFFKNIIIIWWKLILLICGSKEKKFNSISIFFPCISKSNNYYLTNGNMTQNIVIIKKAIITII